jgi:hypothetical protein
MEWSSLDSETSMDDEGARSMEMPMRRFSRTTTILGGLALVVMLALSSPGVRITRAADDTAAEAGEGAVCEPGNDRLARDVTANLQELQRRHIEQDIEQHIAPRSDDGTIVLNNRGYNYGQADFDFPSADELGRR